MCCRSQQKGVWTPKHAHHVKNQTVRCVTIASMPYGVGTSDSAGKGIGVIAGSENFLTVPTMKRWGTVPKTASDFEPGGLQT